MLYAFFWVIPRCLNFICRRFGTLWVPLRPIVSNIGTPTYQLSKYLAGLLSQLIGNLAHLVKNSFQFVQILESLRVQPEDLMVSFDMVSVYQCSDCGFT
jgi:hypothetical protein